MRTVPENNRSSYIYIRKNRLEVKNCHKRQRWILYNDKRSIQQEDTTVINIYPVTIRAPKKI